MSGADSTPRLRVARASDAGAVAAIYAPIVRDTAISFEVDPPGADEMGRRMARSLPTHPWLVAEGDTGILGYAYASPHRARAAYGWSTEVSIYLAERARRRGVGRALYTALLVLAEQLGFHRAFAGITLPNPASAALHEAQGFVFLGRFREVGFKHSSWHDVGWWERPLAAVPGDTPEPPHAFAVWRESAEGRSALERLGIGA